MTTTEVLEAARNNLNSLTDTLWSDTELLGCMYRAMLKMARKTNAIESTATQSTVAGTSTYAIPTGAIEVWRVTYNGKKLQSITWREYDAMNPNSTTSSGSPTFYIHDGDSLILYPTPDAAQTLKVWSYNEPTQPTAASYTIPIPTRYHDVLVDGVTAEMCPKDLGHPLTAFYTSKFEKGIEDTKAHVKRRRRGDRMAVVQSEEQSLVTDRGVI